MCKSQGKILKGTISITDYDKSETTVECELFQLLQ
jgi:hypothetical protein